MQVKNKSALLATAVAAMLAGAPLAGCKSSHSSASSGSSSATSTSKATMEKHACATKNSCKAKGGCNTEKHSCS